ncbi:MAG: 30S ribosome-binding factor RbfA [Bacillota bacterium]|jgi:ribosome-binding factor A
MSQTRVRKMAEVIKEEVSDIISKLKDPRVGFTTVTAVKASKDLHYCTISVSVLGSSQEQEETMQALAHAAGHIRTELGSRIRLRHIPELRFVQDRALEHHAEIDALLKKIKEGAPHEE